MFPRPVICAAAITAPSDFDGNPNGPGDYSSSTPFIPLNTTVSPGVFRFFSDDRTTDYDVYTARIQ